MNRIIATTSLRRTWSRCSSTASSAASSDGSRAVSIPMPWGHIAGKEWGNPKGKPIVAIHGWLDNASSFDPLVPKLDLQQHCLTCIDLPGHGLSAHYPPGLIYHVPDMFHILHRIQDFLQHDKIILLGHSLGAGVSAWYASIFPDRVERLIQLDLLNLTPVPLKKQMQNTRESLAVGMSLLDKLYSNQKHEQPLLRYEDAVAKAFFANSLIHGMDSIYKSSVETLLARNLRKVSPPGAKEDLFTWNSDLRLRMPPPYHLVYEQVEEASSHITCPVMFIKASQSTFYMPRVMAHKLLDFYKANLPHFEMHQVEGGHHVHMNHPELVAPFINQFLQKTLPA